MESDEQNKAHTSQNPKMQDLDKQNQIDDEKGLVLIPNYDINIGGKSVYVHDNFVFPIGYRFCPHDEELIVHYLKKKIMNELLPHDRIKEVNLYKHSPQELAENYSVLGENEWYFFTPRDRKYPNGHRPNRAAGTGYWKATGADKPIKHNNVKVGFRKALVFYEGKPPKGDKTNWIMHEFTVNKSRRLKTHSADMKLDDWVLCRIYKRVDNSKVTRKKEEHHQEDATTKGISLIPNMPADKLENCNYEGSIDSCVEFAKQQFALSFDPNILDFSNYNPDYFPHYGARSSNYGMNLQSSFSPLGNMFSTRSSNYGMNLQSSVSPPGKMFSNHKGLYQEGNIIPTVSPPGNMFSNHNELYEEGNIFPRNFDFNNFCQENPDSIGETEFHNVFDIGILDENSSIVKD